MMNPLAAIRGRIRRLQPARRASPLRQPTPARRWAGRILPLALVLSLAFFAATLAGCSDEEPEDVKIADYGTFGSGLANKLASVYPFRSPGSAAEWSAGDLIIKTFKDLGYQPIVTEFSFSGDDGQTYKSRNIVVKIKGSGFTRTSEDGTTEDLERSIIIGAHYDTPVSAQEAAGELPDGTEPDGGETTVSETGTSDGPDIRDYDGIHDNAAGIGALLTAAREMKNVQYGYDIILVAFGAGSSNQAGARYFASQLGKAEVEATDAMYCIDSIYAGDKVYVHAGRNSVRAGNRKDYDKRRKLYETTDVFYENELYTNNSFMLYTNMSSIDIEMEGFYNPVIYREWSLNDSDYLPFDDLGIPIVFFESYNYDEDELTSMHESKNPVFSSTGGMIRGTRFDSAAYLKKILNTKTSATKPTAADNAGAITGSASPGASSSATTGGSTTAAAAVDQLTRRINNVAFVLKEAALRGPSGTAIR